MLTVSDQAGVRVVAMTHGKVNALDVELVEELSSALAAAQAEPAEALVITGNGTVFSAGVDLFRVLEGGAAYLQRFLPLLSDLLEQLFALALPVVAAIDGHAIAGGCVLACAADDRLAAAGSGRIGLPELRVGVPFPAAALEVVRHSVGDQELPRLVLGGATYDVDNALTRGLVDAIVPSEELMTRALERARQLAALGPAFAVSKDSLRHDAQTRISSERRRSDAEVLAMWKRPETLEAIRVYLDRTLGS